MEVRGCYQFRVTRNSNLFVDEEEIKNMRIAIQDELLQRHFGDAVRLEVADNCSQQTVDFLLQQFGLSESDLYRVDGPVNLYRLREVPDRAERPDLKYPAFQPALPAESMLRSAWRRTTTPSNGEVLVLVSCMVIVMARFGPSNLAVWLSRKNPAASVRLVVTCEPTTTGAAGGFHPDADAPRSQMFVRNPAEFG
jgi:hypothetical protein